MKPEIKPLYDAYRAKIDGAKAEAAPWKGKEAEMPKEVSTRIENLLGEADQIKSRIDLAERIAGGEDFLNEPEPTSLAAASWRPSGPTEGNAPIDSKSWRELKAETPFGVQTIRYHVPLAVQKKEYSPAFEAYIRKGYEFMGPNDRKTLTEGVDTAGGFLTPEDYQTELIRKMATNAVIRSLARRVTTGRDLVKWPRVNYTTDDKYTSGVRMTWTGEQPSSSTAHRVTDPVFGLLGIAVHTAMASMPLTNDLIEDAAFDVLGLSSDLMSEAFALGEDDVFLNGDGVNKPMGLLTEVNTNGPAYVISGTSAAITTGADAHSAKRMLDLYYAVPAQYRRRATWVMNSLTQKEVENLVDAQKRPLIASLIAGSLADLTEPERIKGKSIRVDEFTPDIAANSYPIIFGDFTGYTIVDRVGFTMQRLTEVYAETNLVVLLARKRVGGYCTEPYRLKVMKAGTS